MKTNAPFLVVLDGNGSEVVEMVKMVMVWRGGWWCASVWSSELGRRGGDGGDVAGVDGSEMMVGDGVTCR
ncbi:hypothetical protein Tco_0128306 [Tanacetum coccineum]